MSPVSGTPWFDLAELLIEDMSPRMSPVRSVACGFNNCLLFIVAKNRGVPETGDIRSDSTHLSPRMSPVSGTPWFDVAELLTEDIRSDISPRMSPVSVRGLPMIRVIIGI